MRMLNMAKILYWTLCVYVIIFLFCLKYNLAQYNCLYLITSADQSVTNSFSPNNLILLLVGEKQKDCNISACLDESE